MKNFWTDETGQALVEYVLILAVAVTATAMLSRGIRSTIVRVWQMWNQEIAAPCPGCAPVIER